MHYAMLNGNSPLEDLKQPSQVEHVASKPQPEPACPHMFSAEEGGLIFCAADSAETRDERGVYKAFRDQFGDECQKLSDQAKVLFKVTVEDGSKQKPLVYVGVAHAAKFSEVLDLFNAKYCKVDGQQGAFLLKAGYGINPNKSAGNVFMHYGLDLTFHTKVDFTRVAYAR